MENQNTSIKNGDVITLSNGEKFKVTLEPVVKELEVNRWYKNKSRANQLVFKVNDNGGYGFVGGDWGDGWHCSNFSSWELASNEEIQTALSNEAKRRGFKEGVKIAQTGINSQFSFKFEEISGVSPYYPNSNVLDSGGEGHIFHNGQWAEIEQIPICRVIEHTDFLRTAVYSDKIVIKNIKTELTQLIVGSELDKIIESYKDLQD